MKKLHIKEQICDIDWHKGNGCMLFCSLMLLVGLYLMIFVMEVGNLQYTRSASMVRADAIADSSAVFAQSFDWNYNKPQAEIMAAYLTTFNNAANDEFDLTTEITFPEDNLLTVKTAVTRGTYYPSLAGESSVTYHATSSVRSLDVYGKILLVP